MKKDVLRDLARSKLSQADASNMKVEWLSAAQVAKLTDNDKWQSEGYRIPYFDADGELLDFYRIRFLSEIVLPKEGKTIRYWQPTNTGTQIYLYPTMPWRDIIKDKSIQIIITEGEKKAACACRHAKVPTIGLGGVDAYRSKRNKESMLAPLIELVKDRQKVGVCFDADENKPDVARALRNLIRQIRNHGGIPFIITLPKNESGEKVGLDDYIEEHGTDAFHALPWEEPIEDSVLYDINEELAYIENPGAFYYLPTRAMHALPKFLVQTIYANRIIVTYNNKGEPVEKNAAAEWCKWPMRRTHTSLDYKPGQPQVLPGNKLNSWRKWGVEPKKGDVSMFKKLIEHTFQDSSADNKKWFLQWLAYPLQYPGTKLYTTVLIFSLLEGIGKSLIGLTMKYIYGENFVQVNAEDLHDQWTYWRESKQFVLGDEITGRDKREDIERLKLLIVNEVAPIRKKNEAHYDLPTCANYLLTTNHPDAISLPKNDRRFFVHQIIRVTLPEKWFTQDYNNWYKTDDAAAAIFYYLLHEIDCSDFDPRARPPATDAKTAMGLLIGNDADMKIKEMLDNPTLIDAQMPRKCDLYTLTQIKQYIDPIGKFSDQAVAKALARAGVPVFGIRTKTRVLRVYALREIDRWQRATHAERVAHFEGTPPEKKKRGKTTH